MVARVNQVVTSAGASGGRRRPDTTGRLEAWRGVAEAVHDLLANVDGFSGTDVLAVQAACAERAGGEPLRSWLTLFGLCARQARLRIETRPMRNKALAARDTRLAQQLDGLLDSLAPLELELGDARGTGLVLGRVLGAWQTSDIGRSDSGAFLARAFLQALANDGRGCDILRACGEAVRVEGAGCAVAGGLLCGVDLWTGRATRHTPRSLAWLLASRRLVLDRRARTDVVASGAWYSGNSTGLLDEAVRSVAEWSRREAGTFRTALATAQTAIRNYNASRDDGSGGAGDIAWRAPESSPGMLPDPVLWHVGDILADMEAGVEAALAMLATQCRLHGQAQTGRRRRV